MSIATLEDMKALYDGFDLSAPNTSVSMTINGPAPTILAFFLNTAIDQALDRFYDEHGRDPSPRRPPSCAHAPWPPYGGPSRPTSSRRTRARTPASSPPSSRCG
ncbi:methylmalonyl-CoA mutase family protein [Thermocatellispora tengchongensis]|uniref:methylmalonyl-CoA mutase family protein n=1 Tax=Thermocatellispora tengchongensis TaxID=1073253 RepID=UPI00362691E9